MNKKAKLLMEQASLVEERGDLLDLWDAENRAPTRKEMGRCDVIKARLSVIDRELESVAKDDARLRQTRDFNHDLEPLSSDAHRRTSSARGRGRDYYSLFPEAGRDLGGFESRERFFEVVRSGRYDPRLFSDSAAPGLYSGHNIGNPSSGGFTVPEQIVADMLNKSLESEVIRPRARTYAMEADSIKVAGFDGSSSQDATVWGGLSSFWVPEEGSITESTGKVRQVNLRAKKLAALSTASNELVSDSPGFAEELEQRMSDAISFRLDRAFIAGTGAGMPLGIIKSDSVVSVAKEVGQAAASIVYENCKKMLSRLHPACFDNSLWLAHPSTIPQLLSLVEVIGTGGSLVQAMRETDGKFVLLTRPVIFIEKAEILGTVGDLILTDLSQYAIGLRRGMQIDRSQHVNFTSDEETFRALMRVDGMPLWSSAYQPFDSSASTLSWAVTLATRS